MLREDRIARLVSASVLLVLAACGRDEPPESYSGKLYPGASLVFDLPASTDFVARSDAGEFFSPNNPDNVWYVAPLENGADSYTIEYADDGSSFVQGNVVIDMPPPFGIDALESDNRTQASGRYGPVSFSVVASDDRTARATFGTGEHEIAVSIRDDAATIEWNGLELDGFGELRDDEAAALREISTGPLARALTMVALDLGCREESYDLPLSAYAALVFPWQVILKYEVADRGYVIPHFLRQSRCSFNALPDPQGRKPVNGSILWDRVYAIPMTPFLFPLDGEGQLGAGNGG